MDIKLSPNTAKRLHGAIQRFLEETSYWDKGSKKRIPRKPDHRR